MEGDNLFMMKSLEMRVFESKDIETVQVWFNDYEIQRRLEGMMPLNEWFNYINKTVHYFVWLAFENEQPVGMIMVETEDDFTGSVALVVKPSLRNKGYGRSIIEKTMLLPEMRFIKKWFAGIEEDNFACIKCFQSMGYVFENTQPDEDGYYSLIHF